MHSSIFTDARRVEKTMFDECSFQNEIWPCNSQSFIEMGFSEASCLPCVCGQRHRVGTPVRGLLTHHVDRGLGQTYGIILNSSVSLLLLCRTLSSGQPVRLVGAPAPLLVDLLRREFVISLTSTERD